MKIKAPFSHPESELHFRHFLLFSHWKFGAPNRFRFGGTVFDHFWLLKYDSAKSFSLKRLKSKMESFRNVKLQFQRLTGGLVNLKLAASKFRHPTEIGGCRPDASSSLQKNRCIHRKAECRRFYFSLKFSGARTH